MIRKITQLTVLVFMIAGIVVAIYYSIQYDISCNGNFTTILSGLWSAFATIVLGIIALWQNSQYKKLSDEMTDLTNMPDFYRPELLGEKLSSIGNTAYNSLTVQPNIEEECNNICCGSFLPIKSPILNLRPFSLQIGNKKTENFSNEDNSISLHTEKTGFQLYVLVPVQYLKCEHDCTLIMQYENIYGTVYQKSLHFKIPENAVSATNWKLDKAQRSNY